jgi:ribosomal protein S18 acetylase RimI-like enzyme
MTVLRNLADRNSVRHLPIINQMGRQLITSPRATKEIRARRRVVDVVETDILEWRDVKEPRKPQAAVPLEFRVVDATTIAELEAIVPRHLYSVAATAFLARGDVGFAAISEGRFAGWVWLSRVTHRDPWSGLTINLAPDEAYAYALWVAEPFRPKGVGRALMTRMLHDVHSDPALSRVYGWVDKRNRESQMLLRLLGFKDLQVVKHARVLGRVGLQVPRSDRPRFGPVSSQGRHRATLTQLPAAADTDAP